MSPIITIIKKVMGLKPKDILIDNPRLIPKEWFCQKSGQNFSSFGLLLLSAYEYVKIVILNVA